MGKNRQRDPYAEVGSALRLAFATAIKHGELRRRERVLLAVFSLTGTYSKLSDGVYVDQIAELASADRRGTRRALQYWHGLGVIEWRPAVGRGKRSTVSINPQKGVITLTPISEDKKGSPVTIKGGHREPEKGVAAVTPLPRSNREDFRAGGAGDTSQPPETEEPCLDCGERRRSSELSNGFCTNCATAEPKEEKAQ